MGELRGVETGRNHRLSPTGSGPPPSNALQRLRSWPRTIARTAYYLGIVHAELRDWPATRTVFEGAAGCIDRAREGLRKEIGTIEASNWDPARKMRQIARREAQIEAAARMLTTSWFNIAVANFNLGNKDEARQYAERVVGDEQFAERARDILNRLR